MTSNELFVHYCYQKILGRAPDDSGLRQFVEALDTNALNREQILIQFLESPEHEPSASARAIPAALREFVPPGHYYSAVPSPEDREHALAGMSDPATIPGVDLGLERQLEWLVQMQPYFSDCPFPAEKGDRYRYHFLNRSYSFGDGMVLYAMLGLCQPKRVIEIGSGYSSALMLDVNEHYRNGAMSLTFIEPYADLLRSLLKPEDRSQTIVEKKLQAVDPATFDQLEENDVLFIDSTHVAKLGSDVNAIFAHVLPRVRPGVIVHIHDIFWPFEYPSHWIKEGRAWTELYMLRAFLQFNSEFEILFFSSLMYRRYPQYFEARAPLFRQNAGGNIWLRRKKTN